MPKQQTTKTIAIIIEQKHTNLLPFPGEGTTGMICSLPSSPKTPTSSCAGNCVDNYEYNLGRQTKPIQTNITKPLPASCASNLQSIPSPLSQLRRQQEEEHY